MKTFEWRTMLGLVLAVGLFSAGCATTQSADDGSDRQVQGSPPENAEPEPLPPGPNVKTGEPEIPGEETDEPEEPTATAEETDAAATEEGEPVTTSEIDRLQELGPSYIFQVVRLEPFRTEGDFRGYEIVGANSTAKNVMYPQIEVGDVVTHVNGVHLKRPDDYMKAWKKLDRVDAITVDLLRDGEEAQAVWTIQVTR